MERQRPYLAHLKTSANLETPRELTRAGFVAQALEKNQRAARYIAEARALKVAASRALSAAELVGNGEVESALLTAAGVSEKAAKHFNGKDKAAAIQVLVENFLIPAGADFVEELVFRFLLTRGDALGGSMRNVVGRRAESKLNLALISALKVAGVPCLWLDKRHKKKVWRPVSDEDTDVEQHLSGLSWGEGERRRTLRLNLGVPFVGETGKNVDLCLLGCGPNELPEAVRSPQAYIAFGELKGGIDAAGADEHGGKTAKTALNRIRDAYKPYENKPHFFFVGAAIAKGMAGEIWDELEDGTLENAANLTDDNQVASLSRWLCSL